MKKSGSIKSASSISDSVILNRNSFVETDLPILNVAFSGKIDGGLCSGLTVIAGESKTFKSLLSLYCMKAYLDKYPDGIALFYDSEFGISNDYLGSMGIDVERVLHIPIRHVEELKFDIVKRLKDIDDGDKVFILIDSIGNLASIKEVEDAENEKSVADMSRAKALKSLFRMITPTFTIKDIPCIVINHIYKEMGLYPKNIVSGGSGIMYSANQVYIITKAQEKDGTDLKGWNFTINIEKSRYVREKSKLPFQVLYDSGIQKWSSLFQLALDTSFLVKATQGWYNTVDFETGEIIEPKRRAKDIEADDEFFENLIKNVDFKDAIKEKFML